MLGATEVGDAPLGWVASMLWPDASDARVSRANGSGSEGHVWWIVPSTANPRVLVPTEPRAAALALRQFNDAMPLAARLRKALAGVALGFGGSMLGRFARLRVTPGPSDELVGSFLPRLFGVERVSVAVSMGRSFRPNLKPVLQVTSPRDGVLGYAKVGWNDVSRVLLATEADALRRWETASPAVVRVPRLLHHGPVGGVTVMVTSPMPHPLLRRARAGATASRALADVMALDEVRTATLGDTAYHRTLRERLSAIGGDASAAALEALGPLADREVPVGRCHGDWAPWNMSTTADAVHVWDWERSASDAPLGLDPVQFAFEVAVHKRRAAPSRALDDAVGRSLDAMAAADVRPDAQTLRTVYVVERLARLEEGRAAGVPVDEGFGAWLLGEAGGGTR